ncbi:MAG: GGDEF domain-containing protein [Candidatus Scalindua sp.]|nr:GGDEF domain-containing protein [Candidatus Scalindua sp.]
MNLTETLEDTAKYVRLLLPLMTKHRVPITPINYATWYYHVSGKNKELTKAIDSIIERNEPFSEEINDDIYKRYFLDSEENSLNEIRDKLQQTLHIVFGDLKELSGQTQKYESTALESVDKLTDDMSVSDIRDVLDSVIVATKEIRKSGEAVHQKLEDTTKTLQTLKKEFEHAKTELLQDFLTGVMNRKGFDESLAKCVSEVTDYLCVLVLDIDHFKKFNDKHGHIVGDEVLKFVAKNVQKEVRGNDIMARIGGEEFAVILPKTPLLGAVTVAENVRAAISRLKLERKGKAEKLETITVSIGAAQYRQGESLEDLVNRADQALYLAKNTGRNRVSTETMLSDNSKLNTTNFSKKV